MRIAVDLTAVRGVTTGVERVALSCCQALLEMESGIEWTIFVRPAMVSYVDASRARIEVVRGLTRAGRVAWQQAQLPWLLRFLRIDLLIAPVYTAPLATRCPVLLFVHDTIALEHPEYCDWTTVAHLRSLLGASVHRAWRVVVPSVAVAGAVQRTLESRVEPFVLQHGICDVFHNEATPEELSATRLALQLPGRFVISVGRVERRKNQIALVEAMQRLTHPDALDLGLLLVGSRGPGAGAALQAIRASSARNRIRHLESVDDRTLSHLYQLSVALVFPSHLEGFGIPPLESLGVGTPAIVSKHTPSYLERWGVDEWVMAESDPVSIARRLDHLIETPRATSHVASKRLVIRGMTWKTHAEALLGLIGSLGTR